MVQGAAEQRELDPAGDACGGGEAGGAPLGSNTEERWQEYRKEIAERRGERDAEQREVERRACVAHRVVRGRVEAAEGGREESDGGAGKNSPDVHGVGPRKPPRLEERASEDVAKREERHCRWHDEKG